jgi:hypothetical protein
MKVTIELELGSGGRLGVLELAAKLTKITARVLNEKNLLPFRDDGVSVSLGYERESLYVNPVVLAKEPCPPMTLAEAEAEIAKLLKAKDH